MAFGIIAYSEAPFSAEDSNVIVYPLGIEMTMQENAPAITGDANVPVTGQALTGALGTANGSSLVNVDVTGQALTAAEGTLTQSTNQEINVTGFELTLQESNPTHDTLTAFGEAPFAALSPATFNIPVEVEATVGGILVGTNLPMSLGSVAVTADANTGTLTGQAMTMQEGQAEADDALAIVTGQALTSNLGTAVLDANTIASPSGIGMAMQEGQAEADDASAEVTGIGFSAALGTAALDANTIASPTGQEMTMNEGAVIPDDASAEVTGISMTMTQGSVKNVMWSEVNTGSAPTWTEVDTAA
jgi:hypothetical protein